MRVYELVIIYLISSLIVFSIYLMLSNIQKIYENSIVEINAKITKYSMLDNLEKINILKNYGLSYSKLSVKSFSKIIRCYNNTIDIDGFYSLEVQNLSDCYIYKKRFFNIIYEKGYIRLQ